MFAIEAASLLKNIVCPVCKKIAQMRHGSPFRTFDPLELLQDCPNKECALFYETMNTHFKELETGQINELELKTWLDNFREADPHP